MSDDVCMACGGLGCEDCNGRGYPSRRVRMGLDGGHMDVTLHADASPETIAALRAIGQAAIQHMDELEAARVEGEAPR